MKNRQKVKIYLWISIFVLFVLISLKIYSHFFELNFYSLNYNNIKEIQKVYQDKEDITFAVLGNIKSSVELFDKQYIDRINQDKVDFVISTGNAVADGSENKYRNLNKSLKKIETPFILTVGEGEVSEGGAFRFYKHFGPLYFSFVAGDNYFIFLDTTDNTSKEWQKDWLLEELEQGSKYKNRFVFMNKPLYKPNYIEESEANDLYISDKEYSQFLIDTFSKNKVSAVFSSNIGVYDERIINEVPYYITGGAGGSLILDNQNSYYHYIKVNFTSNNIFEVKRLDEEKDIGFWEFVASKVSYFYSLVKVNIINILIVISVLFIILLIIYMNITKEVDYYRDFDTVFNDNYQNVKLNIAMFTNNYLPFVGGVPISIERLSRGLRKRGHNVYIFAPEYPQGYNDDEDSVVRCKLITYYETEKFDFPIVNIFLPEIEKEFVARNIDIVHVHHPFGIGHKGLKLAKKYNIPAILTYHTRYEKYAHNLPVGSELFKSNIPHKIIKKFAQDCNAIIAPTESAKGYLKHIGVIRPIAVLPTGIETEQYESVDLSKVSLIRKQFISDKDILLCSVSRLTKEKNLYFLIEGLKYVNEKSSKKFKCLIIGDGPERQKLQETIDNNNLSDIILLLGTVEPNEIMNYYKGADLFVFASRSETQGMVVLESMAGKCPVVAVRSSGTDDMIIDEENGYKTKEDVKVWGEKVIKLIEDDKLREVMSENAYQFSKSFSIGEMAKRAENIYCNTLKVKEESASFGKILDQ